MPMDVDEVTLDTPEARAGEREAQSAAALAIVKGGSIIIAADTVLFASRRILGKAQGQDDRPGVFLMLKRAEAFALTQRWQSRVKATLMVF